MVRLLRTPLAILLISIMLISPLLVAGCRSDAKTRAGTETDNLKGWVSANGPVSGANLVVQDLKSKTIQKSSEERSQNIGSFEVRLADLPSDFRIVASGGKKANQDFPATLSADYRAFNAKEDVARINLVTTMVSAYLDKHPGTTLVDATSAIKKYLAIPDFVDIGSGVDADAAGVYFSSARFLEQAAKNGGVNQYISQLVTETKDNVIHPFQRQKLGLTGANSRPMGSSNGLGGTIESYTAGWLVEKIAGGAVAGLSSKLLNFGLSKIGLDFGGSDKEEVQALQESINKISGQLVAMSGQIAEMKQELSEDIHKAEYDGRVQSDPTATLVTRIGETETQGLYKSLQDLLNNINPATEKTYNADEADTREFNRRGLIDAIGSQLLPTGFKPGSPDPAYSLNVFHNQLVGIGFSTPLLTLWDYRVQDHHRFFSSADSKLIQSHFEYWDLKQQWLTELLVQYFNAKAADSADKLAAMKAQHKEGSQEYKDEETAKKLYEGYPDQVIRTYQNNLNGPAEKTDKTKYQKKYVAQSVPEKVFVDTQTDKMWQKRTVRGLGVNKVFYGYLFLQDRDWPYSRVSAAQFVYGDFPGHWKVINPNSMLNEDKESNAGFTNWGLPSPEDLRNLIKGRSGRGTEYLIQQGAFTGATFEELWGTYPDSTGGGVWTNDWFWKPDIAREVVKVIYVGDMGQEVDAAVKAEGANGCAAIMPVRQMTDSEFYYSKK